jgi:hypothetical protein
MCRLSTHKKWSKYSINWKCYIYDVHTREVSTLPIIYNWEYWVTVSNKLNYKYRTRKSNPVHVVYSVNKPARWVPDHWSKVQEWDGLLDFSPDWPYDISKISDSWLTLIYLQIWLCNIVVGLWLFCVCGVSNHWWSGRTVLTEYCATLYYLDCKDTVNVCYLQE